MSKQGRWDSNPRPSDCRAQALKEFTSLPGFSHTLNSVSQWKCFRVRNYATSLLKRFLLLLLFKLWLRNVCFQWCAGTSSYWSREPVWVSLQSSEFSHIGGLALAVVEIFLPWKSAKAANQGFFWFLLPQSSFIRTLKTAWVSTCSVYLVISVHFWCLLASFWNMSPSSKLFAIPLHFILLYTVELRSV